MGFYSLLALSIYTSLSCGQLALGSSGFAALGAYAAALLTLHAGWPFPLVLSAGWCSPRPWPYRSGFRCCASRVCSWPSPPSPSARWCASAS